MPVASGLFRDVAYALRRMRAAPLFTAVAVVTLALGIGGTTAIFSVVKSVLIDPLPYADPDRLALLWNSFPGSSVTRAPGSGFELAEIRRRATSFEGVAGIWAGNGTLVGDRGDGDPEQVKIGSVTGNFFAVLGARPLLGRVIGAEDEGNGRPAVLVLSHGLWQRRFGGDPGIVGRTVRYEGTPATVLGVMPPDFRMVFPPEAQVPVEIQAWTSFPYDITEGPRDLHYLRFVARLREDRGFAQAESEVAEIARQLNAEVAELGKEGGLGLDLVPMHRDAVHRSRPALLALVSGVGLVLLIACFNLANLLLAHGAARRTELAVRAALGASRGRVVRQLLIESLVLAVAGGGLGLLVGKLGLSGLTALSPPGLVPAGLTLDGAVLGFAALVTVGAGVLFGVAPALAASRLDLAAALKSSGFGATARTRRSRHALVVVEVALGFVLLVGAGLMIRTFEAIQRVDPGLRPAGVLSFEINLPRRRYGADADRAAFASELSRRLTALPGVEAAGAISHLPFDDYPNWYSPYATAPGAPSPLMADHRAATPDYLRAIGATLLRGRFFTPLDTAHVVLVDEKLAAEAWPGEDPIGKSVFHEGWNEGDFQPRVSVVVGLVRHVHQQSLTRTLRGQIYIPHAQSARPHLGFVVRTAGDPVALTSVVRREVAALDGELAVARVRPLADYLETARRPALFTMVLATTFAGLALVLAVIGIYGVVATSVSQRRRELAVRRALGAGSGRIVAGVLREGLVMTLVGLILGAIGAVALTRLLGALLHGVSPLDPVTYLGVALLLPAAALLACWLPARRAVRESPMLALRHD